MNIRRAVAAVSVLAATATLAACGSDDQASSGSGSSSSSTSAKSDSGSSGSSDSSGDKAGGRLDQDQLLSALTVGQQKGGSAHMVMTLGGATSLRGEGDVSYKSATPQLKMTMTVAQLGSKRIQMRLVGGVFYMSLPPMTPAGKFIKIDPKDKSNPMGKAFSGITDQLDPMNTFRAMKASVRSTKFVGSDKVQGVSTDHYRVVVDSAALLKAMKVGAQVPPNMPAKLTYDLWLDDKQLLRQATYDVAGVKSRIELSQWGEPVSVTAPPASQLVSPSQLKSQLGGSTTS